MGANSGKPVIFHLAFVNEYQKSWIARDDTC